MIAAQGLTRSFGGRTVVRDVSFCVEPGEVVGFLGPNGAGKTTTMRMLLGVLQPTGGVGRVDAAAGYLPENFTAYGGLSVASYLRFCADMKRLPRATVAVAMAAAHVDDLARRPCGRLSKGQTQRVGLAQAVLGDPAALVLDEPTIGLDPAQVVDARALVRGAAQRGGAVLVSTHLLAEAAEMCDRVVIIVDGAVVAEERPGSAGDLEARFLRLVAGGT
ncbi:MAG TPA: ABC transporter ATP-binding protein [Acidimicrobiales bacterium]|nr:ABC transporter ATP-binding protein [Acidimicrobiales bacterium]